MLGPMYPVLCGYFSQRFALTHLSSGFIPKERAPMTMEVQEALYDFLLDVCEALAGDDASQGDEGSPQDGGGDEEIPDADAAREMGEAVRALATPWRVEKPGLDVRGSEVRQYLDSCREGIPFTTPTDINWDFMERAVHIRLAAVEDDLLSMREDPRYFAEKMQENRAHNWRQVKPDTKGLTGLTAKQTKELQIAYVNPGKLNNEGKQTRMNWHKNIEDNYKSCEIQTAI